MVALSIFWHIFCLGGGVNGLLFKKVEDHKKLNLLSIEVGIDEAFLLTISLRKFSSQQLRWCVFWPANGCGVEIIWWKKNFCIFLSLTEEKKGKHKNNNTWVLFLRFTYSLSFFFSVTDGKRQKLVFMQKQMISTSKRPAEHPFAGQNTQALEVSSIFSHGPLESWSTWNGELLII